MEIFNKGVLAGILIGLGVIINAVFEIPVIGALLFSFGLLTIVDLQYLLYTGKAGFIPWLKNIRRITPMMFLGNLVGVAGIVGIYCLSKPAFVSTLATIAATKFAKSFIMMFAAGVICGALIHFAILSKKPWIVSMAVIIFILIGAEHCIAMVPFLIVRFSIVNLIKWLLVVLGNTLGAIGIEFLRRTGNEDS